MSSPVPNVTPGSKGITKNGFCGGDRAIAALNGKVFGGLVEQTYKMMSGN
jgi:hypothetical protein